MPGGVPGVPNMGTPGAKKGLKRAPRPTFRDARHTLPGLRQNLVHQEASTCTKRQSQKKKSSYNLVGKVMTSSRKTFRIARCSSTQEALLNSFKESPER